MPALEGIFFNQSQWCIEWTGFDCSQITEIVFLMLPSGPLTPTLPFLPGFQQKCLAAILSTYGKTAIWLTLTGLKVQTMTRVIVVMVHFGISLTITSNAPFFYFVFQVVCLTKWRGISMMIPAWYLKRLKVSPPWELWILLNTALMMHCAAMGCYMSYRWHQTRVRLVPRGPVVPAQRLAAALAVPRGSAGRPVQLPLHRLDRPRHGVQTHRARGGETLSETFLQTLTHIYNLQSFSSPEFFGTSRMLLLYMTN